MKTIFRGILLFKILISIMNLSESFVLNPTWMKSAEATVDNRESDHIMDKRAAQGPLTPLDRPGQANGPKLPQQHGGPNSMPPLMANPSKNNQNNPGHDVPVQKPPQNNGFPLMNPPKSAGPGQLMPQNNGHPPMNPPKSAGPGQVMHDALMNPPKSAGPGQLMHDVLMNNMNPPKSAGPGQVMHDALMNPPKSAGPGQLMHDALDILVGTNQNNPMYDVQMQGDGFPMALWKGGLHVRDE